MDTRQLVFEMGKKARAASRALARLDTEARNRVLEAMAREIETDAPAILEANAADLEAAAQAGLGKAALDRLRLDPARLSAIARGIREVAALPDPVGRTISEWERPNGLRISKVRTPIGVVGIIYESRPNVTADAAVLCVKTGNAALLRGGSESLRSNTALAAALQRGGQQAGLPADAVQLVPVPDREAVPAMAEMDEFLDVIVPRGGKGLIESVVRHARMPVIKHYHGLCVVYVDKDADPGMAARIAVNAKCQRPGVCNAMETLLVHESAAVGFYRLAAPEFARAGVEIRADAATREILEALGYPRLRRAEPADWDTEFLDLIMAAGIVPSLDAAIEHINAHGSHHSDAIVTADAAAAGRFLHEVDSAAVYWNAST
ncbi:MAG: glutamate-5-semialdehyde dehydrogenase, partial [Terrimicrobiaceae bacterium]|nr:glutamate-5-semialdehyde dehydrogenase [Terrimicrobiaceae bacterium]